MIGLGTLINTAAVAVGCLLGMLFKKGISEQVQNILMSACGVATMFIGAGGVFASMLVPSEKGFETAGGMLLIISLVLGGLLGQLCGIERRMDCLGEKIKSAVGAQGDGSFVPQSIISDISFVGSALIFCVGINLVFGKKIKVGNFLPALVVAAVYSVVFNK